MNLLLRDIFDVEIWTLPSGNQAEEKLFVLDNGLSHQLITYPSRDYALLRVEDCMLNDDLLNAIGTGYYHDKEVSLRIKGMARDTEEKRDVNVFIHAPLAKVTKVGYSSTPSRFMVSTVHFKIIVVDSEGERRGLHMDVVKEREDEI